MKHLLAIAFITLLAFGMGCAWISPAAETTSDGIQVHGHWTVTVTNPDGTLDAVHEFDNELYQKGSFPSGSDLLTAMLMGETGIIGEGWKIYPLFSSTFANAGGIKCMEAGLPGYNSPGEYLYIGNLTPYREKEVGSAIRLNGSCNVYLLNENGTANLTGVQTAAKHDSAYNYYNSDTNEFEIKHIGATGGTARFTNHTFPTPIEIKHNQILAFDVVISFE